MAFSGFTEDAHARAAEQVVGGDNPPADVTGVRAPAILVEFAHVSKPYDGEWLTVRDLNLVIQKGEFLALPGPSGSGKITIPMMLAGLEASTGGDIHLNGRPHSRISPAICIYFLLTPPRFANSYLDLVLTQRMFVATVVPVTLPELNATLIRAGTDLGAPSVGVNLRVVLPLLAPDVLSGALLTLAVSFDELITAILLAGPGQYTLAPRMFDGVRELISLTITAVATILIVVSVLLPTASELLRRRARQLQTEK